ncbi:unnamed protein product [Musa acuminata subsp. malaccensis]|uniref:(wild Malaysian banana) hypothetical protein n=1 Tax=Musa acuminata subsp. malaccensis TaxID=214687 RepID=A0A8D7B1Q4_MUSAM|nr:unnamed protein product [Musa acuminata subsp. malaccensis]
MKPILEEFQDVVLEEISYDLPPLRDIQHHIDFILGAILPNKNFQATLSQRQRFVLIHKCQKRVNSVPFVISSMLKKVKSDLSNGDSGTTEPDILLEKLFEKTQKLEMMSSDSHLSEDAEQGLNLEISETDVEAAFSTLWKKEEDLKNAERRVAKVGSDKARLGVVGKRLCCYICEAKTNGERTK